VWTGLLRGAANTAGSILADARAAVRNNASRRVNDPVTGLLNGSVSRNFENISHGSVSHHTRLNDAGYPNDRYETVVETWRESQSFNIEFTMKRLREPKQSSE
jgi:hypothetical protein